MPGSQTDLHRKISKEMIGTIVRSHAVILLLSLDYNLCS
uniref:Uncharacterized protein n=1 Tax=Anguilla anguilla TaxID=7936 RepID=A0A0E9WC56_ANGAN